MDTNIVIFIVIVLGVNRALERKSHLFALMVYYSDSMFFFIDILFNIYILFFCLLFTKH